MTKTYAVPAIALSVAATLSALATFASVTAAPDPCAKLVIQAQKTGKRSDIEKLQECRRKQKSGDAPWRRDGAVDDNDYVRVPCPPGMPKWRVCEKRRSELPDGSADAAR
jgi:hypothetical protein